MRTPIAAEGAAELAPEQLGDDGVGRLGRYWYQLADKEGGIPQRSSFDPAVVKEMLPHLVVVEHLGNHVFRYRLTGTEVDRLVDGHYSGQRTSEIPGHGPGSPIHSLFVHTLASGLPSGMILPYASYGGRYAGVRQVALPFRRGSSTDQLVSLVDFRTKELQLQQRILASGRWR